MLDVAAIHFLVLASSPNLVSNFIYMLSLPPALPLRTTPAPGDCLSSVVFSSFGGASSLTAAG